MKIAIVGVGRNIVQMKMNRHDYLEYLVVPVLLRGVEVGGKM